MEDGSLGCTRELFCGGAGRFGSSVTPTVVRAVHSFLRLGIQIVAEYLLVLAKEFLGLSPHLSCIFQWHIPRLDWRRRIILGVDGNNGHRDLLGRNRRFETDRISEGSRFVVDGNTDHDVLPVLLYGEIHGLRGNIVDQYTVDDFGNICLIPEGYDPISLRFH